MRRLCLLGLIVALIAVGCSGKKPTPVVRVTDPDKSKARDIDVDGGKKDNGAPKDGAPKDGAPKDGGKPPNGTDPKKVPALDEATRESRYESAMLEAIDFLAEKKYKEALASLEKAQKLKDTGSVQREIDKVRAVLEQAAAADKAVQDVKTVLDDGKADDAVKLAREALGNYGGGDRADDLTKLKQQADAVVTTSADDSDTRLAALKAEATKALEDQNLLRRAIALEQAVALKADESLSEQLEGIRRKLETYDDNRQRSTTLRRDPARLEEALACLHKAKGSWDTLQVRQEIDEVTLILEKRRDRLSVADFEVRGDVGTVAAGREVADELLPLFKPRFGLVDRGAINKALDELKLQPTDLVEESGQRELGRLAKVRYLVVGSLSAGEGVTLRARLVEASTGLVVQTARVSAASFKDLLAELPRVARTLQMNDDQKLAYEAELARNARPVVVESGIELVKMPPPPEPAEEAPPPVVTYSPRPCALGGLVVRDFVALPLVIEDAPPPPASVLIIRGPHRHRLLRLCLDLGDNQFRRGFYRDAERNYSLALNLAGPRREISVRLDNCRRLPPPPPQFVVVPPRPILVAPGTVVMTAPSIVMLPPPRPRLAVFGFVGGDRVSASLGDWAADSLVPYLAGNYDLIDRGEVCWYMGRLDLTMRDLLNDGGARLCLARALNARFFVFGAIVPTASFRIDTHLIDAETGARTATASIHVQDHQEMRLRMSELANQMGARPDERKKLAERSKAAEKALADARALLNKQPGKAAAAARAGLKLSPGNVALSAVLTRAVQRERLAAYEETRRKETTLAWANWLRAKKRQDELAQQADLARRKAQVEAQERDEAARKAVRERRERAAEGLRKQAKQASSRGDFALAVQLLQSAVRWQPSDDVYLELGQAQQSTRKAREAAALTEQQTRARARLAQAESAQKRIQSGREKQAEADGERRKAQEARDKVIHDAWVKHARALMAKKDYQHALAAAQSARKVRASAESGKLVQEAQDNLFGEQERAKIRAARALAQKNQKSYLTSLDQGQKALKANDYGEAITHYQSALKLYRTDAALSGLKTAQELDRRHKAVLAAQAQAKIDEENKKKRLTALLGDGRKFLLAQEFGKAADAYRLATKLAPGNSEALTGLGRAEYEQTAERDRRRAYDGLMRTARAALAKNRKPEAASMALQALRLYPKSAEAKKLLADATPKPTQRDEDYRLAMGAGLDAMKKGNYKGAVFSYTEALRLKPRDAAALAGQKEAQRLLDAGSTEAAYQAAMKRGQTAYNAGKYQAAFNAYDEALKIKPGDKLATEGKRLAQDKLKPDPRAVAYQNAMKRGKAAYDGGKYRAAFDAYDEALKNRPGDKPAIAGKTAALTALNEATYAAWMKNADGLFRAGKYAEALKAYDEALKIKPGDKPAIAGKRAAQDKLKPKPPDPKEVAYQAAMKRGMTALDGKLYREAYSAYDEALKNRPGDRVAIAGKTAALAGLNEANYQAWMKNAAAAFKVKKYADASKAYGEALKIRPGDPAATRGKKAADDALKGPAKPPGDPKTKQRKVDYDLAIGAGRAAMKAKNYQGAVNAFAEALRLMPGDATATAERAEAQRQLTAAREMAYQAWMKQGQALLTARKWAEALKAYDEALKIKPGDANGIKGKKIASDALKPPVKPPANPQAEYNKAMQQGADLAKQKKYAESATAYREALKWVAGDAAALKTSQGQAWLGVARNEHASRRFAEAVKAYEEVLKRIPNQPEAKAALPRARANKP